MTSGFQRTPAVDRRNDRGTMDVPESLLPCGIPCYRAEGEGFEPPDRVTRSPVFKTGAFDRSATPPHPMMPRPRLYTGRAGRRGPVPRLVPGEVAEWLKALAC
jgi:hypothetical protein